MMQCTACGKKIRETTPQGIFTAYQAGKNAFAAHFQLCIECCTRVNTLLKAIVEENSEKGRWR